VPTLILHGDADQIVPIGAAALDVVEDCEGRTLKVYPDCRTGCAKPHKDLINADLLEFLGKAQKQDPSRLGGAWIESSHTSGRALVWGTPS